MPKIRIDGDEQRRRNRPPDEGFGNVHDVFARRRGRAHARPRRQAQLSFRDDLFSALQAVPDHGYVTLLAIDGDPSQFDGAIRLDDVDVLALL